MTVSVETSSADLTTWDATTVADRCRAGDVSVREVAAAVLERVAERDEQVRAWAFLDPELVMAQARELDAREERGPLHGVPVGIKDVIDTADMPTAHNTARYAGSRPGVDAASVDTLRAAGALIVGKTTTTEFAATSDGGPTRNPHDPTRTPGGSSSGSGAAVADRQCALALGTQTGGSTIRPGSFNGIFAWKPTWGVVSREGAKVYAVSLDTIGMYARSARDLALLADVYRLDASTQPLSGSWQGVRVGVCRTPYWSAATEATELAIARASDALTKAGAVIVPFDLPETFDDISAVHRTIMRREGRAAFLNEYVQTPGLGRFFQDLVENAPSVDLASGDPLPSDPAGIRAAYRTADALRAELDDLQADVDVVLAPSSTGEAPVGLQGTGSAVFNSPWTLMQVPVVNVPGLRGPEGMPVGVSLVGRRYEDRAVIHYAGLLGDLLSVS